MSRASLGCLVFWRSFPEPFTVVLFFSERYLGASGGGSPRTGLRCFYSPAYCSVLSDGPCCLVVGLCILVKVLPKIALCRFWWRFFSGVLRVWDAEGLGVLSWRRPDSPLSHCLSLCWFRSHVVVSGVRPQLGQATVLRVLCVLWQLCLALARGQRQELG
ncbi:hypothetical protein Taro_024396 [Colocasia esculenta]|uniref:Uncharacterized protein n=1 Tax=Colocasia esculenta TaxID=4460 RepID=A0A843VB71_COLES|nr:hypothetical protein [Colocasia esculenta]